MNFASVTTDGVTVESNTESEAQLRESLGVKEQPAVASDGVTDSAPKGDEVVTDEADTAAKSADKSRVETAEQKAERERDEAGRFAKKDPAKRISHLTWEREEARREAARERERAAELERRLAALERGEKPAPKPAEAPAARVADLKDPEPQESDYEDYGKFLSAHARWSARDELRQQQAAVQQREAATKREQAAQQRYAGYAERIEKAGGDEFLSKLSPEVMSLRPISVLEAGERPGPLNALAEELLDSPYSAQLLQYFSEQPEELRRFGALHTARELLRELGKLESRFDAASTTGPAQKAPVISQAKPPVKPVTAAPVVSDDPPGDDADDEAHRAYWNRVEMQRRKPGR